MKNKLLLLFMLFAATFASAERIDSLVATVKLYEMQVITVNQLKDRIEVLKQADLYKNDSMAMRKEVLDGLISEALIDQAVAKDHKAGKIRVTSNQVLQSALDNINVDIPLEQFQASKQFKKAFQQQAQMSWEEYLEKTEKALLKQMWIMSQCDFSKTGSYTEDDVKRYYRKNATKFLNPEILRFSHILFSTAGKDASDKKEILAKAQTVYEKLSSRSSSVTFEEMVRKYSDDKKSAQRGGDVGFISIEDSSQPVVWGEDFFYSIFDQQKGKVSPVLESALGYHIIKVTEYYPKRFLGLDDEISPESSNTVRELIVQQISAPEKTRVLQEKAEVIVEDLKSQAEIETEAFASNLEW